MLNGNYQPDVLIPQYMNKHQSYQEPYKYFVEFCKLSLKCFPLHCLIANDLHAGSSFTVEVVLVVSTDELHIVSQSVQ